MHFVHPKDERHFEALIEHASAPEIEDGHELSLQDQLRDAGVPAGAIDDVVEVFGGHAERMGMQCAAETLRRIALVVRTRGTGGAALARVLGLTGEHSLSELAAAFNCSKQNINQCERRLRATLAPILGTAGAPAAQHVILRPPRGGEWLTRVEAGKLAGVSVAVIAGAARDGLITTVTHRNQHFYEEGSVLAWAEKHHLAIAEEEQRRDAARQTAPVQWA
jgi:hypothetical protein